MTSNLPELPEPAAWKYWHKVDSNRVAAVTRRINPELKGADEFTEIPLFTADQLREYATKVRDEALSALLAEVEALRSAIQEHNDGCTSSCNARRVAGSAACPMMGYRRNCHDCPRDYLIDTALQSQGSKT